MNRVIIILLLLFGCRENAMNQDLQTVNDVDLHKYLGRWNEIASYPADFQKGCRCSTSDYELTPGKNYILVTNRCIHFHNGRSKMNITQGKAYVVPGTNNAKLKVSLSGPFRDDYYIIGLAEDYSWAVIGHPKRKYLWILSRESYMPTDTYKHILTLVKSKGYDLKIIQKTPQDCDNEN